MKKQIISALFIACAVLAFGQTPTWQYSSSNYIYNSSGNLGIGIGATSAPLDKVHIEGGLRIQRNGSDLISPQLYIGNQTSVNNRGFNFQLNASGEGLALWGFNPSNYNWYQNFTFSNTGKFTLENPTVIGEKYSFGPTSAGFTLKNETDGLDRFYIDNLHGQVGLGTTNPLAYLHIKGFDHGPGIIIEPGNTTAAYGTIVKVKNNDSRAFVVENNVGLAVETFRVYGDGRVYATEIHVRLASNFPDYVFSKNYKLLPLKEVEAYYKNNNHLPGIPTAKEVEKEGMNVGEMNKLLLEKIEELTIYVVEQQKQLEKQQKEIELLKEKTN
jgi:hypothetical protein